MVLENRPLSRKYLLHKKDRIDEGRCCRDGVRLNVRSGDHLQDQPTPDLGRYPPTHLPANNVRLPKFLIQSRQSAHGQPRTKPLLFLAAMLAFKPFLTGALSHAESRCPICPLFI